MHGEDLSECMQHVILVYVCMYALNAHHVKLSFGEKSYKHLKFYSNNCIIEFRFVKIMWLLHGNATITAM